jgi:hypothetical protein
MKGPGSFFKPHKDTPRSTNMFGSLVATLPTKFEGGQLVFRDEGLEETYDCSKAFNHEGDEAVVPWVVFFSDVEHEVLPVQDGYRVTLTYVRWRSPEFILSKTKLDLEPLPFAEGSRRRFPTNCFSR